MLNIKVSDTNGIGINKGNALLHWI